MDNIAKAQLESVLVRYEQTVDAEAGRKEIARQQADGAPDEFAKIRNLVIRPVMEEIAATLREHGHIVNIVDRDNSLQERTQQQEQEITMECFRFGENQSWPINTSDISFETIGGGASKKADVHQHILGSGEFLPSIEIGQINQTMVEDLILQFVRKVFV